jgi:hypothetical protein
MVNRIAGVIAASVGAFAFASAVGAADAPKKGAAAKGPSAACKDARTGKAMDCVPATFDTFDIPFAKLPGGRVNAKGELDPKASPADAKKGAFAAAKKLGLFRNFVWLHWVPTAPSKRDAKTGGYSGGDLDGFPTGWGSTGLGIAGNCLYWGRSNSTNTTGPGVTQDVIIYKIQKDAERDPPVEVGRMPQLTVDQGKTAVRDRELRPYNYVSSDGKPRMLMVRSAATGTGGDVITYTVNPQTCLPVDQGAKAAGVLAHEFYLWHDPKNPNRFVVASQTYAAQDEDLIFTAITDEKTGEVLQKPQFLASFALHAVGGPPRNELPDKTGLYLDGRFTDYSTYTDQWGRPGARQPSQINTIHSGSVSDDGERFYAAGTTAGMFILDTEFIARNTNAALAAGTVCNPKSTDVWTKGPDGTEVDVHKLPQVAKDCVHPVLNDDPGLQAMLASTEMSDVEKLVRFTRLETKSRLDVWPSMVAMTGNHSAVPVPDRPSMSGKNPNKRPAYVIMTEEWPFGPCPERGLRIASVESEINPTLIGAFAMSDSVPEACFAQPKVPGAKIRPMMHAHNPTVFKNLVFVGWLGHGLRAIDISNPFNPREVGHARPVPWGDVMTYPDFHDGLIYIGDNNSGLHVLKYTGPRADEIPKTGTYSSNRTSPH